MRVTRFILPVILLLITATCNRNEKAVIKRSTLNREEMISLLTDVHIIESLVNEKRNTGKLKPGEINLYYDQLFKKNRINRNVFYDNLSSYLEKPEEFKKMYEEVITELSKRQGAARKPE